MDCSRENCLELIDRHERYPVLWNPKHGLYYNKVKKFDAWTIIDENLGCAPGEAKKKLESILASFRREEAKEKQSVGTGKAKSKWFAFPRLAFLLDRDEPRKTVDIVEEYSKPESEIEELDYEDAETLQGNDETVAQTPKIASQTVEIATTTPQTSAERRSVNPLCKRKKPSETTENSKVDEALGILKSEVANNDLKADGCSMYGQHVAYKLRAYTNKTRNIVEHHINNILFNADMGHYDGTGLVYIL